jgi:hypothetical protein
MFRPWCSEQVKLLVQILMIVSDWHASFVGFGALSKPWLFLVHRNRSRPPPRELMQFHAYIFAHEMPLFWKQSLFRYSKDLGEELNLLTVCRTSQRLDVGQNVTGNIDISKELQLGDQFILRPASLIAQPRHISPDDICVPGHPFLRASYSAFRPFESYCIKAEFP